MKKIDQLITETKGKFFTLKFQKKDGSIRTINSKDFYRRLIVGAVNTPTIDGLREKGFKSLVNRNKESWYSFQPEKVLEFKCGAIHETF